MTLHLPCQRCGLICRSHSPWLSSCVCLGSVCPGYCCLAAGCCGDVSEHGWRAQRFPRPPCLRLCSGSLPRIRPFTYREREQREPPPGSTPGWTGRGIHHLGLGKQQNSPVNSRPLKCFRVSAQPAAKQTCVANAFHSADLLDARCRMGRGSCTKLLPAAPVLGSLLPLLLA